MLSVKNSALKISIIASIVCSALAMQCYHCDSTRETACGDKFESQERFKVDCDRLQQQQPQLTQQFGPFIHVNASGCVKKFLDYLPGQIRIQRTCVYGDMRNTGIGCQADAGQRVLNCEVCTKDYCNGSSILSSTGLGILFFFILARIFA